MRPLGFLFTLFCLTLFAFPFAATADTWWVDDDAPHDPGPNDPTISDPDEDGSPEHPFDEIAVGMIFAQPGDVVIVRDGTYAGPGNYNLNFLGKAITVRSQNGPADCTIDCATLDRAFYFHTGESADTVVEGFTIINGLAERGGAMYFAPTTDNPSIRNCRFVDCTATGPDGGGAVCARNCAPTFADCTFINNTASDGPAAFACFFATIYADRCRFINNDDNALSSFTSDLTLNNCLVAGNDGCGVFIYEGQAGLANCTVVHNYIDSTNGAGVHAQYASLDVFNCIAWGNIDSTGNPDNPLVQVCGASDMLYSCIQGLPVPDPDHNIAADPLFADPVGLDGDPFDALDNDYQLSFGSPGVDAADNTELPPGILTDCNGAPRYVDDPFVPDTGFGTPPVIDMGAFERQIPIPDGDFDDDGDVDPDDADQIMACLQGPEQVLVAGCESGDFEPDFDVDLTDMLSFQTLFDGPMIDCNGNGIQDYQDIATGYSQDCNGNGVPDECDIADGTSQDCQPNGIPDECDIANSELHPGLVHRWSFNTDAADSVGSADATLMNGATIDAGSVELDGADDYVELPIADTVAALDSVTLEAWLVWDGGGNWQRVFDIGTDTSNYMFLTPSSGGDSRFAIRTPTVGEQQLSTSVFQTGELKHVAVTIDATTNTATLYIDGAPVDDNPNVTLTPADLGASTIGYLGKSFWPDPHLDGRVSEFRIYEVALDATELAASYEAGPDAEGTTSADCNENGVPDECDISSGHSEDLDGNGIPDECEFDDCNGNGVPDDQDIASGYSQDCNGNAVPDECDIADGTSQDCQPNGVPDECDIASGTSEDLNGNGVPDECESSHLPPPGYGLELNGVDGYVDLGVATELSELAEGEFTLEMWIKTADGFSRSVLIGNYDGNPSWNFEIHDSSPPGHLRVYLDGEDHHCNVVVTDDVWHHVAAVRRLSPDGSVKMFVDGQEVYDFESFRPPYTVGRATMLGRDPRPMSHYFTGVMDEVRVWDYARTEVEIQQDMCESLTGQEAGLIGYWSLDEGSGTLAEDLASDNDGTLFNGCLWVVTP